ncbi:MAG: toll/interleukin-1 receptor domain-containing protein [Methyloceanibacter sp.]|uniref:toll/interleukin-1 receptor domain-containing protein n=1 Tax=Methyloceanibacter sp. TaxID=1965321 RepID=UPI003D6D2A0C
MTLYDAFISYSHAQDKPIAGALQSVVQKLGKPWYRRRALRVFRDDTSLSATPHLWPSIEKALSESSHLILFASPEAAASPWVSKEVDYWLKNKTPDTMLIGLTAGELAWNGKTDDFKWSARTPLPKTLKGRRNGSTSGPIATAPIRATRGSSSLARTSPRPSAACQRRTSSRRKCGSSAARALSPWAPQPCCSCSQPRRCGNGRTRKSAGRSPRTTRALAWLPYR